MSNLPKLNKDISENPSKNAVTAPNDPRRMEADIDRKMRLYGVIQGFREGKLPSNRQIDETLDYFVSTAPFDTSKLSKEGQELIDGFRQVVMTAKKLLLTKNQDELIQNFIWNTREIDYESHAENIKGVSAPVDKDTARSEGQEAVENLRVLAKLLFTNSEVRKLVSDATVLLGDVGADAAQNAANKLRPDEDSIQNADEPAPDSQWIGPNGEKRGPNDPVPDTGVGAKVEQAKAKKDEIKSDAQAHAQEQANQSSNRLQNDADPNNRQQSQAVARDEAGNAANRAKALADKHLPDSVNRDNVKGTVDNQKEKTKNYLKEKFPEERREKFIYRLKKVVVEQQKHDDYNQAIDFFIDQFYNYKGRAQDVAGQAKGKGGDVRSDPAYQNAETELRVLLERFANNTSMQPIFDAVDVMYSDARNDDELRNWWSKTGDYIRRVLQEEGYVMTDQCNEDGRRIQENGRKFWDHKYKGHREDLFNAIEEFAYAYNEDPLNKRLGVDIKKLLKSLIYDSDGKFTYKPHLISDLRHVIIPSVLGEIGYVPIPRAEYTDNQFDIVVENLTMEVANILPNLIEITNRNYFKLSPYDSMGDYQQHEFRIAFSQIQADLRDVAFYFKKKTGFPRISDSGLADVVISGKGIYGDIHLETTPDAASIFRVKDVTINIDEMKWKLRETKHNFLYNLVRTTLTGIIKKSIAKAVQMAIRNALVQLDQQLTDIRDASREGAERDDSSRLQAVKDRLASKKQTADEKKEKAKETKEERDAQFKLVASRDQEMINWESKNSYVGKQGTLKEHAKASDSPDGWKSPVFDITHTSPTMRKDIVNQDLGQYKK